jgi:hypothetical protein
VPKKSELKIRQPKIASIMSTDSKLAILDRNVAMFEDDFDV